MHSLIKILLPRQLFLLLILSTGLLNHVILIPNLLTAAGRDSWLSVLIAYVISILFLWGIHFILKNSPEQGFFFWLEKRAGRVVSFLFSLPVVLFLFISSYITLRDLIIWLNSYFLSETSVTLINLMLVVVCFLITWGGIKYMAISSGFLLPLVMLLGFFIAFTNTSIKDPNLLLPLLSEGFPPLWKGVVYALSGLLEVYIVILLQPFVQKEIKFHHLFILLTIITGLTLGPLTAAIMEFGPTEATNFRYPAYEQWRVLNIGDYISHLDFFALFQWLSGALIRIGLFMYLLVQFFTRKKHHYHANPFVTAIIYILLLLLNFIRIETYDFYQYIYRYFLPACMGFFLFQILVSALLLLVLKRRNERHGTDNKPSTTG